MVSILKKESYFRKLIRNSLDMVGIFDGEYAYKGPDCVQIDLTNNCNNNCIACWCNSPLLEDKTISLHQKGKTLDYPVVIRLIDTLSSMGTRELFFSGGGEPLMHPRALDILSYAKKKGFICHLNTNFTLADETSLRRLMELGLDHLVVSLWAGTPQTYALTHPNKNGEVFLRMKQLLRMLNETKEFLPRVRVYNVICNANYKEFFQMVDLCLETSSECVEFTVVDTIPGRTEVLLLNREQLFELIQMCETAKNRHEYYTKEGRFVIANFDHFLRRLKSEYYSDAEYDKGFLDTMPCYVGWLFARVLADGNVNSCLKSHRTPVGNVYEQDFSRIWNGVKQLDFRRSALKQKNESSIFSRVGNDPSKSIGCYKSCDDLGRNIAIHKKISKLTSAQKYALKRVASLKRLQRHIFK